MSLSDDQLTVLFRPINEARVQKTDGYSNLEAWDVEAHLIRIFGFDWDKEVSYGLIYEIERPGTQKDRWDVAYHAKCRLTIDGHAKEDVATGSAKNQPSRADAHDLALKAAVSGAEKRAAKALGNQFGLSLYNNGSVKSVVGSSLAYEGFQRRADAAAAVLPGLGGTADEA